MNKRAHKTPVQIIRKHLSDWLENSSMTETTFATLVREAHEARYEHSCEVEWSHSDDPVRRMQTDQQRVARWFEKSSNARMPAEMYDVVVLVFPPERRFALEQELAAARDGVFVLRPEVAGNGDVQAMGLMAKEASEAIAAVGALVEDGVIDERDAAKAESAIVQIDEAVAKMLELRDTIRQKALGEPSAQVVQFAGKR